MVTILQGDCVRRLRQLQDGSVHCVVTSPPYDKLRTYGGFRWNFEQTASELFRVLCDGGILCWNVGDSVVNGSETLTSAKQKIFFREEVGFRVHDTMIYEKTNFAHPERTRYHQVFEYVFILSKGAPRVFNPIKDKRNVMAGKIGTFGRNTIRERNGSIGERKKNVVNEFAMRGNVWRGNTAGQEGQLCKGVVHPALMPKWLARDLIYSWSNPGDVVLDPLAGSGTTGAEALKLGRRAVLIELNRDYIPVIRQTTHVTPGLELYA